MNPAWIGYGDGNVGPSCGEWHVVGKCDTCGEEKIGQSSCKQRTCPECADPYHIEPRTKTISARVITGKKRGIGNRVVITRVEPDVDKMGIAAYFARRSQAHKKAKERGMIGGAVVTRPNSGKNSAYICMGLVEGQMDLTDRQDGWSVTVLDSYDEFDFEGRTGYLAFIEEVRAHVERAQWPFGDSDRNVITWFGELDGNLFNSNRHDLAREERRIADLMDHTEEENDVGAGGESPIGRSDTPAECPVEGCNGTFWQIHKFDQLLQRGSLGQYEYFRAKVAYQYFCGVIEPPPGLESPSSEAEYEELLEGLLEQEGYPTAPRDPVPAAVREKAS